MITYKLVWDDFCSWYLEIVKPNYGESIDIKTYEETIKNLEKILKLLHPFMPFISEEIWHSIDNREDDIIIAEWPQTTNLQESILSDFSLAAEVVSSLRNFRKQKQIPNKEKISLFIKENEDLNKDMDSIIVKLGNLETLDYTDKKINLSFNFMVGSNEYFIPFNQNIDIKEEKEKIKKELDYTKGFLKIVEGKLSNKKFVENAPTHLVENEKNKMEDAKRKIEILNNKLESLSTN